ncbi:MAG TPA: efflux RND transporter periplasmic adaptor subunit [Flavisolibacter sp.]|jgi:membrane fusion protein (multidrug efflux system)|nr:efflux RND transporter periplasmic adaptor subunit [Flavisolibacter sp.]
MRPYWTGVIAVSLFIAGCASNAKENETPTLTEVPVIKLQETDTSFHLDYVADIQAVKNVEIRARIDGFLDKIYVDEGSTVRKGQLLFRISNQELFNELAKAKASVQSARAAAKITELEMQRVKVLVEKKIIAKSELDLAVARLEDANAKIAQAVAEVADAQTKLSYLSVRSPFNGVIDRIPMKPGSLITDGSLLTTLSDNNQMYAYFDVSENEYLQHKKASSARLKENGAAALVLSDGTRYPHKGFIETQEAEFSDNTGSIAFRAKFPNPEAMLKHGASGKVQLVTALQQKLLVPQKAVLEIQDKSFVFVVGADNTVKMKSFTPNLRIADYFVVEDGLKPGDVIVYEGVQNIRDGAPVKPRFQQGNLMAAN